MPEYRYFPKGQTRTIIDYNAIMGLIALGQCAIVCLPVSVVGIIRKLLLDRGLWRTTYVLSYDDMGYYIPTELEFNPIRQEILSALQELENMSCSSDFRAGLADVANAIRALANAQCCSNIGVTIYQGTDEEGGVIFGTEPPGTPGNPETDPPPDGYDTWEEWYAQLCQNIHALVDSFVTTLSNLSYLSIFNLSLLVSAVGAFILMPPAISPMLLYWLAQLVLSLSTLRDLGDWIAANKSELVCAIYNADNAAAAQTAIRGVLSDGLTAASVDANLHPTIISIAMALLSTDTLNQLYDGSMVVSYPGAECDCLQMPCQFSESTGTPGSSVEVVSFNGAYTYVIDVEFGNRVSDGQLYAGWVLSGEIGQECYCANIDDIQVLVGAYVAATGWAAVQCDGQGVGGGLGSFESLEGFDLHSLNINQYGTASLKLRYTLTVLPA
jgi:hypothetical protein